jgi:hypothetical protein
VLTRNHRQEALCRAYVQAVAGAAGLITSKPEPDYGIDLSLRMVLLRAHRRWDASVQLDLQLKSTAGQDPAGTNISYDLDVDAYEALRAIDTPCPRLLVVLLPEDEAEWLHQTPEQLALRRCAWWMSLKGWPEKTARRSVRVAIPGANVFSVAAVKSLMQRVRERKDL